MSLQQPTYEGDEFILAQLRSSNTDRWASSLQAFRGVKGMHIGACSPLSFVAVKNIMTKNSSGREGFITAHYQGKLGQELEEGSKENCLPACS